MNNPGTAPDVAFPKSEGEGKNLAEKIDALLPQTQCRRCDYPGCKPYAEAIARNEADINQCPPGGAAGIYRLAALLGREYVPLSPAHGVEMPQQVVVIDENRCIGCTLCIQACPVDAIVGANKLMHTVITDQCTGCELCIEPCPVDCIDLVHLTSLHESIPDGIEMSAQEKAAADAARDQYEFRLFRLEREQRERGERLAAARAKPDVSDPKQALITAALERVRQATEENAVAK